MLKRKKTVNVIRGSGVSYGRRHSFSNFRTRKEFLQIYSISDNGRIKPKKKAYLYFEYKWCIIIS